MRYVLLGAFGLVGIFARYGINSLALNVFGSNLPAATITINIVGCFLIGLCYVAGSESFLMNEDLKIAIMAGLLGGFTTFSAFSLETVALFTAGRQALAAVYATGSIVGGLLASIGGLWVGRWFFSAG
jgi:CrcB protein